MPRVRTPGHYPGVRELPNKEMKLTSVERIGRSQLISVLGGREATHTHESKANPHRDCLPIAGAACCSGDSCGQRG